MIPTPHELHDASIGLMSVTVGSWLIVFLFRRSIGRMVGRLLGGRSIRENK